MSDPVRLHHCAQARSFRVLWLLHEIGVPHEVVHHSFFDRSLRSPGFLALSPAGRVPALEIDGRVLFESGAIIEYLCETRAPHLSRAPGDPQRAEWLEWLHFAETLGQHLAVLTQQHIVLREDFMRSPTVMRLEAKRLEKSLGAVVAALGAREWMLGPFSGLDVALGYAVHIGRQFLRYDVMPGLDAYHRRIMARPGFQAALAADGPVQIYKQDFYEAPDG